MVERAADWDNAETVFEAVESAAAETACGTAESVFETVETSADWDEAETVSDTVDRAADASEPSTVQHT